jgi:hypothetical protein
LYYFYFKIGENGIDIEKDDAKEEETNESGETKFKIKTKKTCC